jgi:hypothetical protein
MFHAFAFKAIYSHICFIQTFWKTFFFKIQTIIFAADKRLFKTTIELESVLLENDYFTAPAIII